MACSVFSNKSALFSGIPLLENVSPFQSLALKSRHTAALRVVRHSGLIRGLMIIRGQTTLIEVYSLNEGCWRITNASFPSGINFTDWRRPTTSLNGAVHFGVYDECKSSRQLVLSFDLGDEVFRLISLPNAAVRQGVVQTSVIGGSLSLLFYDDRHVDNNCCAIWVMKDYGAVDSCAKLFAVEVNKEIITVLGLQKNGSMLVEAGLPRGWGLSSYDPKSQQVKNLGICGRPYYFHFDNYVENLVLLNKPNDAVSERGVSRKRKCRSTSDEERVRQQKTQLEERVCQQKTLLQQQEVILKQQIILKQQREEMAWQTEKMVTLKSQLAILIQQLRGQSGDMFNGARDQSATQVQQGSPSASQET